MTNAICGEFVVKLAPLPTHDTAEGSTLGRRSINKTFHRDLSATSVGEMLSAGTAMKGWAGYVAIERVTGVLGGKAGTFVLQHSGTMTRGEPALADTVVPDSGTGELVGLTGRMTIEVAQGKHFYVFEYTLPAG